MILQRHLAVKAETGRRVCGSIFLARQNVEVSLDRAALARSRRHLPENMSYSSNPHLNAPDLTDRPVKLPLADAAWHGSVIFSLARWTVWS
jgi:hypothetical protein